MSQFEPNYKNQFHHFWKINNDSINSILEKKFCDKGQTDKYYLGDYFSLADIFIVVVLCNFADKLKCVHSF